VCVAPEDLAVQYMKGRQQTPLQQDYGSKMKLTDATSNVYTQLPKFIRNITNKISLVFELLRSNLFPCAYLYLFVVYLTC
jgi:hypothetical protein